VTSWGYAASEPGLSSGSRDSVALLRARAGSPWRRHPRTVEDDSMKKPNSPMQVTRAADYAVRVMIHLAASSANGRRSLPALAEATGAPESFLSKVMQALTHAGLISSRRGQAGGFQISAHGRAASMREVIEAVDGTICLNLCLTTGKSCRRKTWCPAHPIWVKAQQAMLDVLAGATVTDLAAQAQPPLPEPHFGSAHAGDSPAIFTASTDRVHTS